MVPIKKRWDYLDCLIDPVLTVIRRSVEKEGLYIEDTFKIRHPYWVCFEFFLILVYYLISIWLILIDSFSFWVLILNCICLARAMGKTTLRNNKYTAELRKISKRDYFNRQTRFFLENNCQAYVYAQRREKHCIIVMLLMATLMHFISSNSFWIGLVLKGISILSLLGAAADDFFSDAAEFYEATPALPKLAET